MEFRKVTKLSFKEITSDLEATFYRLRLLDSTNIYSGPFSKILDFLASKKFFYFCILQTRIDFILKEGSSKVCCGWTMEIQIGNWTVLSQSWIWINHKSFLKNFASCTNRPLQCIGQYGLKAGSNIL